MIYLCPALPSYLVPLSLVGPNWHNSTNWGVGDCCTNNWFGVGCWGIGAALDIHGLTLDNNNLNGTLTGSLAQISELFFVDINDNPLLTGNIPPEWDTPGWDVKYLTLNRNSLTGPIPPFTNLPNLWGLIVEGNALSGPIPAEIFSLPNLRFLLAHDNQLSGAIPNVFNAGMVLQEIGLHNNLIESPLPVSLASVDSLTFLDVAQNELTESLDDPLHPLAEWVTTLNQCYMSQNLFECAGTGLLVAV